MTVLSWAPRSWPAGRPLRPAAPTQRGRRSVAATDRRRSFAVDRSDCARAGRPPQQCRTSRDLPIQIIIGVKCDNSRPEPPTRVDRRHSDDGPQRGRGIRGPARAGITITWLRQAGFLVEGRSSSLLLQSVPDRPAGHAGGAGRDPGRGQLGHRRAGQPRAWRPPPRRPRIGRIAAASGVPRFAPCLDRCDRWPSRRVCRTTGSSGHSRETSS